MTMSGNTILYVIVGVILVAALIITQLRKHPTAREMAKGAGKLFVAPIVALKNGSGDSAGKILDTIKVLGAAALVIGGVIFALYYFGDDRLRAILQSYQYEGITGILFITAGLLVWPVKKVGKPLGFIAVITGLAFLGTIGVVSVISLWPSGPPETARSTPIHTPRHATRSQCDGVVHSVTLSRTNQNFTFVSGNCRFLHDLEMPSNSAGDCVRMNGVLQCGAGREQPIRVVPPYRVHVTLRSTSTGSVTYNFIRCPWRMPRGECFGRLIAGRR
ncbi:hypothetical protein COU17_03405 [Candidatus Kaiserbacteria bacterium CG10_big_fil_rev_8_21_14_0_10_49_17]|uniref:Uncharacterized protein n=1 Tax=Candidatus Kaiserbacteria bacterium CG10_big_fil_rev_8_21_14_0_10_49_17 TaxID=1974609 RepID=A0A2M6WDJ0_9BACT|nr:MAG: hypothetical protein COU17_03405 [Candidatus Kaiserbacteria bacterium CG10_big_fil_rev_8_21_14_0_10_49_17]